MTYYVNYYCLLLQVDTKKWLERDCIQRIVYNREIALLWNIGHFVSTAKFCINVVSAVKYSEKRKS